MRNDKLMIVKNCYQFLEGVKDIDYIANGDIAKLISINHYEDRYGLHFAQARLSFPDYGDQEISAKVCLDTLDSESSSLTYEQQNALYQGVSEDYAHLPTKKKRYEAATSHRADNGNAYLSTILSGRRDSRSTIINGFTRHSPGPWRKFIW